MSLESGIQFGGSNMCIAYSRDDKLSIIVNEAGYRTTPAVLSLADEEYLVGIPAKQNLIRNSKSTILYTKHFVGKSIDTVGKEIVERLDCEVKIVRETEIAFVVEDKEVTVCDAIHKQLKYLNDLAKTSLSVKDCNLVLSAPCYFTKEQCEYLKNCAQKAGFNALRVIKNPVAACLGYDLDEDDSKDNNYLVYQLGGNSLEVTLINITNGLIRILDSNHVKNVGGDMFTSVVIDILCEEFQRKHKSNPKDNKRSMFKLKANAEELKMILSTMERAHCSIDALYDGIDFDHYLTRQRFESGCSKLYQQILQPIDDLLQANKLTEAQIEKIVLAGAATKMCKLQTLIGQKFGEAKLLSYQSPDEVISLGCAKQCALISNSKYKKTMAQDSFFKCLSKPIFYQVGNSEKALILKDKLPLPIRRNVSLEFDSAHPFLLISESDRDLVKIHLNDFKTKEISLMMQIKMDESIEITVTETSTNERITLFLNSESAVEQ